MSARSLSRKAPLVLCSWLIGACSATPPAATPQGEVAQAPLMMRLLDPLEPLARVSGRIDWDQGVGRDGDRARGVLRVEPVIPLELGDSAHLILHGELALARHRGRDRDQRRGPSADLEGSLLYTPKERPSGGLSWGAGLRTAFPSEDLDQMGLGPELALVRREGPWMIGARLHHLWSLKEERRGSTEQTAVKPFLVYLVDPWALVLETPVVYERRRQNWSIPVEARAHRIASVAGCPLMLGLGVRYWVDDSDRGPEGLGLQFSVNLPLTR